MKHLSRILIIVMLIVVTGGVVPAAAKPEPVPPPTVTVDPVLDALCATGGSLKATANVTVDPATATLTDFHMYVEKIGTVQATDIAYEPTVREESWGFYWWTGSAGPMPTLTPEGIYEYVLDTNDEFGVSWIQYSKVATPELNPTDFYLVSVYAGAADSKGKGGGAKQSRAWDDYSWTVNCSADTDITQNTDLTYCRQDAEHPAPCAP